MMTFPDPDDHSLTRLQLFEVIVEQDIDFGELEAEQLPEGALDLLRLMLEKDPDERITAADALEHSWIRVRLGTGAAEGRRWR